MHCPGGYLDKNEFNNYSMVDHTIFKLTHHFQSEPAGEEFSRGPGRGPRAQALTDQGSDLLQEMEAGRLDLAVSHDLYQAATLVVHPEGPQSPHHSGDQALLAAAK